MAPRGVPQLVRTALCLVGISLLLLCEASAYKSSPHYGAGRRIKMSDIKTLTFYADKKTAYRRTDPLPQLTCQGSPCRRFKPDAVQCTSMGDEQWKCSADLPPSIRMGRVEVSCEGYEYSSDPYVLKDSCALTYHLLPAYGPDEDSRSYYRHKTGDFSGVLFKILFWSVLGYIAYSFLQSLRRASGLAATYTHGRDGGGGGGGGGGGWMPGWGGQQGPPPPYMKDEPNDHTASANASWRPGFWTGVGVAGAAAAALNSRRRDTYQQSPFGSGSMGYGRSRHFDEDSYDYRQAGPSSSFRSSTGFGGTRNR